MNDIVDRQLADEAPAFIHHGSRNQRVFLEAQGHLFLVHRHRNQRLIALHHVVKGDRTRSPQYPGELYRADRVKAVIHHEHFPEFGGQVIFGAQVID